MDAEIDKQSHSIGKEQLHKKLEQRLKKMVDKARVSQVS